MRPPLWNEKRALICKKCHHRFMGIKVFVFTKCPRSLLILIKIFQYTQNFILLEVIMFSKTFLNVIHPPPKPSLVYKCKKCEKKIKLLYRFLFKKQCPCCGSHDFKLFIGLVEESSCPFVH